jgi:DNA invertase Pin-like site-specific DNA recombinase
MGGSRHSFWRTRRAAALAAFNSRDASLNLANLAEFERELLRDRVRAGLARVKATGQTISGRAVGRLKRDVDLDAAAGLRAQGRNPRASDVALKVPARTLHRAWQILGREKAL